MLRFRAFGWRNWLACVFSVAGLVVLGGCNQIPDLKAPDNGIYRIVTYENIQGYGPILAGTGSGFMVNDRNLIATNRHVIEKTNQNGQVIGRADIVYVVYIDKSIGRPVFVLADILKSDNNVEGFADLALLRPQRPIPGKPLQLADYAPAENSQVTAVGFPGAADLYERKIAADKALKAARDALARGQFKTEQEAINFYRRQQIEELEKQFKNEASLYVPTATIGIVSRNSTYGEVPIVQHQAAINPGNSGGPLFDGCGNVVGINTFAPAQQSQGIFMALGGPRLIQQIKGMGEAGRTASSACLFPSTTQVMPYAFGGSAIFVSMAALLFAFRRNPVVQRGYTMITRRRSPAAAYGGATQYSGGGGSARAGRGGAPTLLSGGGGTVAAGGGGGGRTMLSGGDVVRLVPAGPGNQVTFAADRLGSGATVGRDPSNDGLIDDKTVSKRHARLSLDSSGRLSVEDLGSANGTWKGKSRITRETFGSGDMVRFGSVEYRIELPGQGGQRMATRAGGGQTSAFGGGATSLSDRPLVLSGIDSTGRSVQFSLEPGSSDRSWIIGRKAGVADLVIPHQRVSSEHARVRFRPGRGFELCDTGSSNGTKLDGRAVGRDFVALDGARKVTFGDFDMNVSRG